MKSDIPFSSEFSPNIIDLEELLGIARDHLGDRAAIEQAIKHRWFDRASTKESQRPKLAMNTRLGLQAYGILDRELQFTELGISLVGADTDEERYASLARHMLANLRGAVFVETILDMQAAGDKVVLNALRRSLEDRGVHTSMANKSMSVFRLWLEKAGVFRPGRDYAVDRVRYEELLGISHSDLRILADLPKNQRAYVRALAALVDAAPVNSQRVRELAERAFGGRFDEKQLPKSVLFPLRDAGLVTLVRTGGRAKPFLVQPTPRFQSDVLDPLLVQFDLKISPGVMAMIRRPLTEIVEELSSPDRHVKGLALEAFAFRLMWLIGLRHQGTRLSGTQTGGAEVDLVFDSVLLAYSRWQIQCKNTGIVSLDDVAKEVGVAQYLLSNAIAVVSTGRMSSDARRYARHIVGTSNLAIVLIDRPDIARIVDDPISILGILEREASTAFTLKPLRLDE